MAHVDFDVVAFRDLYPGIRESVTDEAIEGYFYTIDAMLGDGKGNFPWEDENRAKVIVNAAVCHLVTLFDKGMDAPARLASATQGSVSTSFENIKVNGEVAEWWNQTQCGALFWQLTLPFRSCGRVFGVRKYHPWG